jgi:hypothetical protein
MTRLLPYIAPCSSHTPGRWGQVGEGRATPLLCHLLCYPHTLNLLCIDCRWWEKCQHLVLVVPAVNSQQDMAPAVNTQQDTPSHRLEGTCLHVVQWL